jgi:hypothetical protein
MPPVGSGVPALSEDEKRTIARWIDLGCPLDVGQGTYGWFLDDLRPALAVTLPRAGWNSGELGALLVGAADADSGLEPGSLSIKADVPMAGRAAGVELADLATVAGDGIWSVTIAPPLIDLQNAHLHVAVADRQGNVTRVDRRFSVGAGPAPTPTFAPPQPTPTPGPGGGGHDSSASGLRRPKRVHLRDGVVARSLKLRIKVRNEDVTLDRGGPGHEIQLVANPGNCPASILASLPDFAPRTAGDQDRIVVRGGKRKTAVLVLNVAPDDFFSPDAGTPARCQLTLTAVGPDVDPTPANNVATIELAVYDDNDR